MHAATYCTGPSSSHSSVIIKYDGVSIRDVLFSIKDDKRSKDYDFWRVLYLKTRQNVIHFCIFLVRVVINTYAITIHKYLNINIIQLYRLCYTFSQSLLPLHDSQIIFCFFLL